MSVLTLRSQRRLAVVVVFATCLLCAACSDDEPVTFDFDAGASNANTGDPVPQFDADIATDAGAPDTADGADAAEDVDLVDPTHCPPTTTVDVAEPTKISIDEWIAGDAIGDEDLIGEALDQRSFEIPEDGDNAYDTYWRSVEPGDDGTIDAGLYGHPIYAATTVEVEEATSAFARADEVRQVYVNGLPQPGDVYGDGDKRVPIALDAGENQIVLRYSVRLRPEFELFTTPDDVYFNTEDPTYPDLRVGTDRTEQLGVQILNLSGLALTDVEARILENDHFHETAVHHPALGPGAVTQVAFELEPKAQWENPDQQIPVHLQLASCQSGETYDIDVELQTVAEDETFVRTFRSPVDNSVQYYGVVPPKDFDDEQDYGLALSMHGASVEASSQANQYTQKDWMYVIAPTNRRPFGFDWEEWGRLNALASLDHAKSTFRIDPSRVYATGHSMGGHGTWHLSVMHPGRFAALGPSAGWSTFYSYSGQPRPSELLEPARAHSDTYAYMSNLANRGAYILHGNEDNNVPISEGKDLRDALLEYSEDVVFHEEDGADHWWDGDASEGQDCVDWPPMFEFFEQRTLDVTELDFQFTTPGQWIGAEHSYVALQATESPFDDAVFTSEEVDDDEVELNTENVLSMDIDTGALIDRGVQKLTVDGDELELDGEVQQLGPRTGKTRDAPGLLNPTFHRPFCFVYPDDRAEQLRAYTAYLLSSWSLIGNGHGCALPLELLTDDIAEQRNLIYVGVDFEDIPDHQERPFSWDDDGHTVGPWEFDDSAGFVTFRRGDHQSAAFIATKGKEYLLFRHQPFSSRAGMPDYFFWSDAGGIAGGYFDADWQFDDGLGAGGN